MYSMYNGMYYKNCDGGLRSPTTCCLQAGDSGKLAMQFQGLRAGEVMVWIPVQAWGPENQGHQRQEKVSSSPISQAEGESSLPPFLYSSQVPNRLADAHPQWGVFTQSTNLHANVFQKHLTDKPRNNV